MMIVKISDATCISEICWKQLPAAEQRKGEGRDGEPEPGHEEGAGSDSRVAVLSKSRHQW